MKVNLSLFLLLMVFAASAGSCNREKTLAEEDKTIIITSPGQDTAVVDTLSQVPEDGVNIETPANGQTPELHELKEAPLTEPLPQRKPRPQEQSSNNNAQKNTPQSGSPAAGSSAAGSPAAGTPVAGSPAAEGVLREGSYRLLSVQGEALPLVLDMTTDCDSRLMRAELQLQNGSFQFRGLLAEECGGEIRKQEEHTASGSYRLEGKRIFLNVESGEILGDAAGVVEGAAIRLQQISNDEEAQEVDWVFQL